MNGDVLFRRVVDTVQEICLKVGDIMGSVSLYYPCDGDTAEVLSRFALASSDYKGTVAEELPGRIRVTVSEEDCIRMSRLPVKETMRDVVTLINERADIERFRREILLKHEGARLTESHQIDHDWVLMFPEDNDVYCITVELGRLTYHRFYRDEYLKFGYNLEDRLT